VKVKTILLFLGKAVLALVVLALVFSLVAADPTTLAPGEPAPDGAPRNPAACPVPAEQESLLDVFALAPGRPGWAPLETLWGQQSHRATLVRYLRGGPPVEQARAALALGLTGEASAREALAKALTSPDATVREMAALGLAYLGDERGEATARLTLGRGPDWQRYLALVGLWRLDTAPTRAYLSASPSTAPYPFLGDLMTTAARTRPWTPAAPDTHPPAVYGVPVNTIWEELADNLVLATDYWWHQGQYEQATYLLQMALFFCPDRVDLYGDVAWLQWSQGRDEMALATLRQGIAANPQDPLAHFNLGFHYFNTKRFTEALPFLCTGRECETWWAPANTYAHCLEVLGKHQEAVQAWEETVKRFPTDEPARRALQRLREAPAAPAATP
jgi:tetratricopeptide (TPR) repeat protein